MSDRVFIDTNILLYAYSETELNKSSIANDLIFATDISSRFISNQVINECVNILFKKFKLKSNDVERAVLEIDKNFSLVSFDFYTQIKAINLKSDYSLNYYDALIIATALENNCNTLFSEDMQHAQVIDNSLTIINPFT